MPKAAARKLEPMVPDSARLLPRNPRAIDLNAEFHRELRAKRIVKPAPWNRGWGRDWTVCPECDRDPHCMECGGEGGWPASATRFDDVAHELGEDE